MCEEESIESRIQLLVEGNDHRNFFRAFISHILLEDIQVRSFGGVNDLSRFLPAFVSWIVWRFGTIQDFENRYKESESYGTRKARLQARFRVFRAGFASSLRRAGLTIPD